MFGHRIEAIGMAIEAALICQRVGDVFDEDLIGPGVAGEEFPPMHDVLEKADTVFVHHFSYPGHG